MGEYEVYKFQKDYSMLDNKFQKADKDLFDLGVLIAYTSELNRGFIVKKQLKTTSKGTKFNYEPIKSNEEAKEYLIKVKAMAELLDPNLVDNKFNDLIKKLKERNEV